MLLETYIRVTTRLRQDEGEVGSWLLIAALLAAGAVAAGGILSGWFSEAATDITTTN